ncbi:M16 family metallopeptidase [Sphingomonas sp. C3-2]|uniref:M16 family metallopeptidase n=1 Tax=Sphingomonas sp. C3-2 TaxID=3062169 RepID=UPI00294B5734|nr:insulinase family protein [Sphingomonas sp. C3-2]WOK35567.1 insulinase family protein [Sphingomonas sp. C3-2]
MTSSLRRFAKYALLPFAASIALTGYPLAAQQVAQPAPASAQQSADTPWLYRNSDVPQEKAWTFGVLDNGVRYAVRRNGVPPGQVAIRVRIDAGALMEKDSEQGFAHFIEHLSFRGSQNVPEGESKRIWQRLGATFGFDSNASTTATETIYKLDLPDAHEAGIDDSLRILADMMAAPNIAEATVNAERAVVMAEQREQFSPAVTLGDATRKHFFAGQPLASRSTIGTSATLGGASAAALRAFHDRWYRPERAVVVIAGDADPAMLEALVKKHFSSWRGEGSPPADPDFGKPDPSAPRVATMVEPSFPTIVQMAVLRPWEQVNDTITYNEGLMVDSLAVRLINRRLEQRARAGGSFLQADVRQDDVSRSADATFVSLVPLGDDWQAALRDVRAVVADATRTAPTRAEIDREIQELDLALLAQVENQAAEPGSRQADDLLRAVDIRETVTTAEGALSIFRGARRLFTPENVLASTKRLFEGAGPRLLLSTPRPVANADKLAEAALTEDVSKLAARANAKRVTFNDLPRLGAPAKIVSQERLGNFQFNTVGLSNGVKLVLFPNRGEPGKVYVNVRFGDGYKALPGDRENLLWSGSGALVGSGIGKLGLEELEQLTNGRKINMGFTVEEDAFVLKAETREPDLADQLRLIATKLAVPGWDPAPVIRTRAQMLAGYDLMKASPSGVITRDLDALVRGGDTRWVTPTRSEIEALTPQRFRAFWEPILASGPIEVQIFGDFDADKAIEAARQSFGAMKMRSPTPLVAANTKTGVPQPNSAPLVRTHSGATDQSAAVIVWPTGGGLATISDSRRLEVLAAIFNDRLFEQLRSAAGASYSPTVASQWPTGMDNGGYLIALGQMKPESEALFFKLSREIAADLAAKPVDNDELQRTLKPIQQFYMRASTGNPFWMRETAGVTRDPQKLAAMESLIRDLLSITPADIQRTAQRYLAADKSWTMVVLPEQQAAAAAAKP